MKKIKLNVTQSTPVTLSLTQNQPISLPVKARGPRGLPSDLSTVMGVVAHGTDAEVERPDGYTVVTWIGEAEPVNSIDNDIWIKT